MAPVVVVGAGAMYEVTLKGACFGEMDKNVIIGQAKCERPPGGLGQLSREMLGMGQWA